MIPIPYLLTQNTCNGVRLWGDSERFSLAEAEEQRGVVSFFPLAQQAGWIFSVQVPIYYKPAQGGWQNTGDLELWTLL